MPIGLLILTAIPTTIGVAQGITQDRRQRDAEAAAKAAGLPTYFSLYTSSEVKELDGKDVTIRDGRIYIGGENHPFAGYLRDMLETEIKAMVTTTCNDPPAMGWVYVHAETHEVRVGSRAEASEHRFGVWGYDESGLVMDGESAFWAVEGDGGGGGEWGLYYLEDGDEVGGEAIEVSVKKTNISDLIPPKG